MTTRSKAGPVAGAPGAPGDQALAAALLPVLLHRIRNTTQLLTGVNAVLAGEPDGALPANRAEDLRQASREAEELGWLLAVLSGGLGCDLAGERRTADGLRVTLALVRDALRRNGRALELPTRWPRLGRGAPAARLCLAVGALAWRAGRDAEGAALELEQRPGGWHVRIVRPGPGQPSALEALAAALPEAHLRSEADGLALELPPDWLAPAGPAA